MQHVVAVGEEPTQLPHDTLQMLIQKSVEAKKHAYCVYSKFRVGAALLTADGSVYTGKWLSNLNKLAWFLGGYVLYLR